jgi:hypothetical protein
MLLRETRVAGAMLVLLAIVVGCAQKPPPVIEVTGLQDLSLWYSRYAALNDGVGPASADDLKEFIVAQDSAADTEAMFTSVRDGEAVVLIPAQMPATLRADGLPTVMAFERTGDGSKRYVVMGGPTVEEMENERLAEILPVGITLP